MSLFILLAALGIGASLDNETIPQHRFELTGIERFWEIAAMLLDDGEPSDAQWDQMFATPGYAALEARERRRPALQQGIRVALKPSLNAERERAQSATSWTARVTRHIQSLPARKSELDLFRQQLAGNAVFERAIWKAQSLLPGRRDGSLEPAQRRPGFLLARRAWLP